MAAEQSQNILDMLRYLFNTYAAENDITTDQLEHIQLGQLLPWASAYPKVNSQEWQQALIRMKVTTENEELLIHTLADPHKATLLVSNFWPLLTHGAREVSPHPVKKLTVSVTLDFGDGIQHTLEAATPREEAMTDAMVITQLQHVIRLLSEPLRRHGSEAVYQRVIANRDASEAAEADVG